MIKEGIKKLVWDYIKDEGPFYIQTDNPGPSIRIEKYYISSKSLINEQYTIKGQQTNGELLDTFIYKYHDFDQVLNILFGYSKNKDISEKTFKKLLNMYHLGKIK